MSPWEWSWWGALWDKGDHTQQLTSEKTWRSFFAPIALGWCPWVRLKFRQCYQEISSKEYGEGTRRAWLTSRNELVRAWDIVCRGRDRDWSHFLLGSNSTNDFMSICGFDIWAHLNLPKSFDSRTKGAESSFEFLEKLHILRLLILSVPCLGRRNSRDQKGAWVAFKIPCWYWFEFLVQ